MTPHECSDDLLISARRGQLTEEESQALAIHLRRCASCALDAQVHATFESPESRCPGDERMISEAVSAALSSRHAPRSPRPRSRRWTTAAFAAGAILVTAGLASAGVWWVHELTSRPSDAQRLAGRPRASLPVNAPPAAADVNPPGTTPDIEPPAPVPSARVGAAARQRVAMPRASSPSPSAPSDAVPMGRKELFAAANDSRRRGDSDRAQALYAELQRRFPGTPETRLSFVSLGRVFLAMDTPGAALAQFDRYLAEAPSDVLAAEALYGRARALKAMHRDQEARRSWTELLERFPESIYADQANHELRQAR